MVKPNPVFACSLAFGLLDGRAAAQEIPPPPERPPQFRAVRTRTPISVDGHLSEAEWQQAAAITEFVQREPAYGVFPSYRTEVRVAFDEDALYIAARCHQPRAATRVRDLRRDFVFEQNDVFGVAIDGFLDKRNAAAFQTTPYGSQGDLEIVDVSETGNVEWDARWRVRTHIEDAYWTAEIAIPWRTLRYPAGADRLGILFVRNIRSRNEQASAPAVPRALATYRMSYEGELHGVVPPPPGASLQLKPYVLGEWRNAGGADEADPRTGGEMKLAITPSTVLDLTWNTDFAQADADRQVNNLDRFSVFFPERRQFFLENANIFTASVTEWLTPFFSRRIGLDETGRRLALDGGLRLTSRSAEQELAMLAIRQPESHESPASNFAVVRYSRNLPEQSRLGGMFTYRHDDSSSFGERRNSTYTLDGVWQPSESVGIQGMLSASSDEWVGDGLAGQLWASYKNDRLQVSLLEYYDSHYHPGIGLEILDADYWMHSASASFDFRSEKLPASIRSINPNISAFVFESADDGHLLFGYATVRPIRLRFRNGARLDAYIEPNRQQLEEPFSPSGIEIAPGRYGYTRYGASATTDPSAELAASASIEAGQYFDGESTTYAASARIAPWPYLEVSVELEINEIHALGVAAEDKRTGLYGGNVRFALSPRLQLSGLYQWADWEATSEWNLRLSWEYEPLSYLYLIYSKNLSKGPASAHQVSSSQVIAKLTYVFDL